MTGIILAGGKNRRMGFNKAFIDIGGQRIIQRTIGLFRELFDEIILVANNLAEYEELNVKVVSDIFKDAGSLGGIYTGLFHASSEYSFVAACDMPFLNKEAISKVNMAAKDTNAVVPFILGRYHPLHAAYSKKCLNPISKMIKERDLRITNLFHKIKITRLDEKDWFSNEKILLSLDNINTREDLDRIVQSPHFIPHKI